VNPAELRRTDADNLELIQRFYPESLATYLGLPAEIYRANMVRNAYLHRFGGVYADLDLESLRLLDNLLDRPETVYDGIVTAFVASMEVTTDHMKEDIPNAWMASSAPGHPLWLDILRAVEDR
jgi:mannosyltransferase OCH1-like enzyme